MTEPTPDGDDETTRAAKKDLERLAQEGNLYSSPLLKSSANSVRKHFAASDADQQDAAELWGTRIGRGLAAIAFVALLIWLGRRLMT